jgi:quinol monooxygenase YgiN
MISDIQGEVRKMPGCVKIEWYSVPNDPERYITYREFVTQEDFERYLNSASV